MDAQQNFQLLAAMNPCPCGFLLSKIQKCNCTNSQILNYLNKLSGPIIDRIDSSRRDARGRTFKY
ncbi:MAG: ATP-binding protein [Bdellovibrionota bacterium]